MRALLAFVVGITLVCGAAAAQDASKGKAIQVIVGPDGTIRVIDVATGKEVGKLPVEVKPKLDPLPPDVQKQVDEAREKVKRALQKLNDQKVEPKRERAEPTIDKKLDLILKQLEDLRKDVDGIKKKFDGKQPDQLRPGTPDSKPRPKLPFPIPPGKDKEKDKKPGIIEIELMIPGGGKDVKPSKDSIQGFTPEEFKKLLDVLRSGPVNEANKPGKRKKADELTPEEIERLLPNSIFPNPTIEEMRKLLKESEKELPQGLIEKLLKDPPANKERKADGLPPYELEYKIEIEDLKKYVQSGAPPRAPSPAELERRIEQLERQLRELQDQVRKAKPASK